MFHNGALRIRIGDAFVGKKQCVANVVALVVAFAVVMGHVLPDDVPQEAFSDGDELAEAFLLDRANEALGMGIENRFEIWPAIWSQPQSRFSRAMRRISEIRVCVGDIVGAAVVTDCQSA